MGGFCVLKQVIGGGGGEVSLVIQVRALEGDVSALGSFGGRGFSLGELWREGFQPWGALEGGVSVLGYKYELWKEGFQSWDTSKRFNWQGYILSTSLITCHTL